MAGVPVICCLDNNQDCIATLRANHIFNKAEIYHDDIISFPVDEFGQSLNKIHSTKVIVIGGPPCQPFSKAAYWITNESRKGINDHRNMIGEYLRILTELRPDGFLLENVESIIHPTNRIIIDVIISHITNMDYDYRIIKATALDYGVPQKRKRVFIIGSKNKFTFNEPRKTHCRPEDYHSTGLLPYEPAGKHILKYDVPELFEPEEVTKYGTYGKELEEIPPGKNYFALTERDGYPNPKFTANTRFWSFLLKLHPDQPSWTIAAQPGPWVGPFHWTSRRLRIPEIAAIQTFPEDFKFIGSHRSIRRQIGNAVPPLMGKAMVEFLKENL